jgi:hypothetical protein
MLATDAVISINTKLSGLEVNSTRVLELLGYAQQVPESFVLDTISSSINQCLEICQPAANLVIKEISLFNESEGIIEIEDCSFKLNRIIGNQLKGSQYLALFICTIGKAPELLSKKLFDQGDALEGYVLSLVASEAADNLAAHLHDYIKELCFAEGLGITNRFSPGYCRWDVADQKELFSFFPENSSGITLNDSALMTPIKSVSGIVGIGKNIILKKYPCSLCDNEKCLYR